MLRAGRWYLLAWDLHRDDWRIFRVDRVRLRTPTGRHFVGRAEPAEGFDAYLVKRIESATWQRRYRVHLAAPAGIIRERAPLSVEVTEDGAEACIATVGSDSAAAVARYLSWWEVPFTVLDSEELGRRCSCSLIATPRLPAAGRLRGTASDRKLRAKR